MRITLRGPQSSALAWALKQDGDTIVKGDPELVLTDFHEDIGAWECPVIGGKYDFHPMVMRQMGLSPEPKERMDYILYRWFDLGWRAQTSLGIPLHYLNNDELGPRCEMGLAARPLSLDGCPPEVLDNPELEGMLRGMNYIGMVWAGLGLTGGVRALGLGLPYWGLFGALEGARGALSGYLTGQGQPYLRDGWTSALALSRYPYPWTNELPLARIPLTDGFRKHFWPIGIELGPRVGKCRKGLVGVSTGRGGDLSEANRRALVSLTKVEVPDKQYRTDGTSAQMRVWTRLRAEGFR